MDAERLKATYRRWLLEVWGAGRYEVDDDLIHVDLIDHSATRVSPPDGPAMCGRHRWSGARSPICSLSQTSSCQTASSWSVVGR
jgi:hypothetical protein